MTGAPPPVEQFPRSIRAPYDQPTPAPYDGLMGVDTDRWRQARRADRAAALHEPLAGLDVSAYESHVLTQLAAGADTDVVGVLNRVLHAARAAAPLDDNASG